MAATNGSLQGRVALVTGGASGIGRAVCVVLSREGARCVVADRNISAAQETIGLLSAVSGGEHSAVEVDVGNRESVSSAFEQLKSLQKQPADIIVNCAGIFRSAPLLDVTDTMFDDVINVNLKGTFLVTQLGAKEMVASQMSGSIVNISSIVGKTGCKDMAIYSASKSGVIGFTKSAAQEFAKYNIRCNSVLPGVIDTPMTQVFSDEMMNEIFCNVPLGRKGSPEDVAELIKFLASNESSYVTGSVIEVTGGLWM